MTAVKQPAWISIADYLAGEELADGKHEFIGGVVHAMAGANNRHNTVAVNAVTALSSGLRGKPCQVFNSDTKVRIDYPDHTRFYYPDAMVVCASNPDTDHFQERPVAIVEVLSESTRRTDLSEKRDAYLTMPSLKVLMFVEPDQAMVTVYRRRTDGGFAVELYEGLDAAIPLPEIAIRLDLAELYERVAMA